MANNDKNIDAAIAAERYTVDKFGIPKWKNSEGRVIKSIPRTAFFSNAPGPKEDWKGPLVEGQEQETLSRSAWRQMAWKSHFAYEVAQATQNEKDYNEGLDPAVAFQRQLDRLETQLLNMGVNGEALKAALAGARAKGPSELGDVDTEPNS